MNIEQIRRFFPAIELPIFFEEIRRIHAGEDVVDLRHFPYSTMLWMHAQFGIPRDQMIFLQDGEVLLSSEGVKAMARKRLQDADLSPDQHDFVIDFIDMVNRTTDSSNS